MQFNTGTPSLVGRARFHAGESSAASGTMFPDQECKDSVNEAYAYLWNIAKDVRSGWGVVTCRNLQVSVPNPLDSPQI